MGKEKATDQTLTIGERADALLGIDDDAEQEAPAAGRKAPKKDTLFGNEERVDMGSLVPDLLSIFPGAEGLVLELKDVTGVTLDLNPPKKVRVKSIIEPDDIYTGDLTEKNLADMNRLLLLLLHQGGLSNAEIRTIFTVAQGRGLKAVSMIRQRVWKLIWDGYATIGDGVPADRKPEHDNEDSLENQRLIALLEYSVFDAVQNFARRHDISPTTALGVVIKNALPAPNQPNGL